MKKPTGQVKGFSRRVKVVYKITYPTGKIYIGKDRYGSARYMGTPDPALINADFESLPEEIRRSYSLHKEILWQSETASEAELSEKEVEFIRKYRANDPTIGYNRWPKFRAAVNAETEGHLN